MNYEDDKKRIEEWKRLTDIGATAGIAPPGWYDPHKYDYLHAEVIDEEWMPRKECTCNACFLYRSIRYSQMADFVEDYKELVRLLEKYNGDMDWAFDELVK